MIMDEEPLPDQKEYILHGEKLDLIPASIDLSVTEINLRDAMGRFSHYCPFPKWMTTPLIFFDFIQGSARRT
jgi:hypothetical protein